MRLERTEGLAGFLLAVVHTLVVYMGYKDEQLWRQLLFLPPASALFFHSLWRATINDYLLRFITVGMKSLLLFVSKREIGRANRRTAAYLTAIEHFSLLYRTILPMPVWYVP